jgi:hypothetical protein
MTVASDYPARVDDNGTVWYRPAVRDAREIWGWTALRRFADPSYHLEELLSSQRFPTPRNPAPPYSSATGTPIAPPRTAQPHATTD